MYIPCEASSWTLLHQNRKLSSRISLQNRLFCLCRLPAVYKFNLTIPCYFRTNVKLMNCKLHLGNNVWYYVLYPMMVNIEQIFIINYCNVRFTFVHITAAYLKGRRGRDRMVVGFTTTYAISAYHYWCCEFEARSGRGVQHYVIKFVSDLRQVGGFLQSSGFLHQWNWPPRCIWNIVESGVKHNQTNKQTAYFNITEYSVCIVFHLIN